jgi:hypothetical protein
LGLHPLLNDQPLTWTISSPHQLIPLSAGAAIAAADSTTGVATRYSADKGVAGGSSRLASSGAADQLAVVRAALLALPSAQATIEASDDQNQIFELIDVGRLIGLSQHDSQVWSAPGGGSASDFGNGVVAIVNGSTVTQYSMITGAVRRVSTVKGPVPGGSVKADPVGGGLLLAGSSTGFYS